MRIEEFRITRFQFARDRAIGSSQVRSDEVHVAALELVTGGGHVGLGFIHSPYSTLPDESEIERIFRTDAWPGLEGEPPAALCHRTEGQRGCKHPSAALPYLEAIEVALWDLSAKQLGLPLHRLLGSRKERVRAYVGGLDFHLSDDQFVDFYSRANSLGFTAFKIQVGHPDFERDLHRLELLARTVRPRAHYMIDANEAWGVKEAILKLQAINFAGYDLLWAEDPILSEDHEGLRRLSRGAPFTSIASGSCLDAQGKRRLIASGGADIINVGGKVTDALHIGRLSADIGLPTFQGNSFLEIGVHVACAMPDTEWVEYSFQNFEHLVDRPIEIRDGWAYPPDRFGHGLVLSDAARKDLRRPHMLPSEPIDAKIDAPDNRAALASR